MGSVFEKKTSDINVNIKQTPQVKSGHSFSGQLKMYCTVLYSLTTRAIMAPAELTSKTKTNLRTDQEQFIRPNNVTARPLISVRPAEI